MIQSIEFYYDPSCVWCWITSRWLKEVTDIRGVSVTWRPFSLALKNEELVAGGNDKTPHAHEHRSAHRVLRLIESAVEKYGENVRFELYTAIGEAYHVQKKDSIYTNELITDAITSFNYEIDLHALDDIAYDRDLQRHLDTAFSIVGDDSEAPIIVFEYNDTEKSGFYGPLLTSLPSTEDGLKLWDSISSLSMSKVFKEFTKHPTASADTLSTQRLL